MTRAEELEANLSVVRRRIAVACAAAGRDPDEVSLVVVTKYFPATDLRILRDLGVRDVGENRHQEAEAKAADLADLDLVWHFVGSLQSNKAAAVAAYADVVHSVDRTKLLTGLSAGAHRREILLPCLVQVDLDPDPKAGRGGVEAAQLSALCDAVAAAEGLQLRGLMAVAPLGVDPAGAFDRLADLAAGVRRTHPGASWLSAGMSADLEHAVKAGATHVRVGSAVLGPRPRIK